MERTNNNAVGKDEIQFWSSPLMGDGEELAFRTTLPPLANGAPLHVHDGMTESFDVVSGALEIDCGSGDTIILQPGEAITMAPGTPHGFQGDASKGGYVRWKEHPIPVEPKFSPRVLGFS